MNPLLLLCIDLGLTLSLLLLVVYVTWFRKGAGPTLRPRKAWRGKRRPEARTATPVPVADDPLHEGMARRAEKMRRQGHSVAEIARSLEASTGEVEMVLAITEMGRVQGDAGAEVKAAYGPGKIAGEA